MTFKIDFSKLDRKLSKIIIHQDNIISNALAETAEIAVGVIVQRTELKGKDKDGRTFKKYSESYARQKKKASAPSRVNLTGVGVKGDPDNQGGEMLKHLLVERVEDNGYKHIITVSTKKQKDKLQAHVRGEGRLPIRNPIGFTRKEDKLLVDKIQREIRAKIRKIGLA